MFGIKKLKYKIEELKKRCLRLKLDLLQERNVRERIIMEMEFKNRLMTDKLSRIEKNKYTKDELIKMLAELSGVTVFHAEEKSRFDIKIKKNSAIFIIE